MSADPLPDNVRALLTEHIRSLRGLELLLLLHADPTRQWSAQELSDELRASALWAEQELVFLARRGFLSGPEPGSGKFQFAPRPSELASAVDMLSTLYPARRFTIIQTIYSAPSESIRRFADAFRLRKENPDG